MPRLRFTDVEASGPTARLCDTVYRGLSATPKTLPPRLFYDHAGSNLFEAITGLPEYYLTRTEAAILERHASSIVEAAGESLTLIEFGSGSSRKTRLLIEAVLRRQKSLRYLPIDISRDFLRESSEALLGIYPELEVDALAGEYFDAARAIPPAEGQRLVLFLGSNIGNLAHEEAIEFLSRVRQSLSERDRLLVGTDMVKDRVALEAAYNDAQGVTAAFNLNLLRRLNRELDADFNLACFRHHAPFDPERERIEMRLISLEDQEVRVGAVDTVFRFADGEPLLTEWSQKYTRESFAALCRPAGLEIVESWNDECGWFTEWLLRPC